MGLRSRKAGAREAREARDDAELQFVARADAPLRDIHVQTEAFNLLWRDMLFKLSCALVLFSVYAASEHREDLDCMAFDALSAVFYALSAAWLRRTEDTFRKFTSDPLFRASLAVLLSQLVFSGYAFVERGDMRKEFVPMTAFYLFCVTAALFYMRSNSKVIMTSREELSGIASKEPEKTS